MGKGKDLPAVNFHAVLARRDPALAERLVREGIATGETAPALVVVPPPIEESPRADETPLERTSARHNSTRKRGLVPRSDGREAGRITVYVPTALALRLRAYCFEHDRTMTDVAGEVLIDALEQRLTS